MNPEIHNPELAGRVQEQMQSGHFQSADELIEKALDALDERALPYQDVDLTPPRVRLSNVRDVVF